MAYPEKIYFVLNSIATAKLGTLAILGQPAGLALLNRRPLDLPVFIPDF